MESLRIPASNDAIPEGISFITAALKKRRIRSKEASRAILMAEEVMVKLFEHAAPGAEAKLSVVSVMGSLSLKISVPGGQFEFGRDVDLCLGLDVDAEDSQAEASIRDLLLNAFRDKLWYRHRGGCNIVQIAVKESERRLLYWTVAALLSSIVLSVGAPGVPGAGLVCLSVLLVQLGIPVEGAGLIMAIDSIVGMFRCLSNTTGDVAITLVVARLEKLMDTDVYYDRAA